MQKMYSKTIDMQFCFVKSNPMLHYTLNLSCASCQGCGLSYYYAHVVYSSFASLKRVVQKRQSLPCNLQDINCTK
jgi:hypothetical protein